MEKSEYNNGYPTDTLTVTIKTCHGSYLHQVSVDIPPEMGAVDALELVQRASPYTKGFTFDPSNENHCQVLGFFNMARLNARYPNLYHLPYKDDDWFPGHSWTWIKVSN